MAKNKGYILQDNVKRSCERQDILFYRFKDCGTFFNKGDSKFTPSNICDCMFFIGGTLFFIELKSVKGKSFSFSDHSIKQLNSIDKIIKNKNNKKRDNVDGGFIIEFREIEEIIFISVKDIFNYFKLYNTSTLNYDKLKLKKDVIKFIDIDKKILRTNYSYDFLNFYLKYIKIF